MDNKSAYIYTWGCSHNQKDTQLIEYQLLQNNINLLSEENKENADIIIFNTCTVKSPTENKITHIMDKFKESTKTVIVAGCISQSDPEFIQNRYPNFIVLGVNASTHILDAIEGDLIKLPLIKPKHLQSRTEIDHDWVEKPYLGSTQWNKSINVIQINEGCLNACTFCATRFARGRLKSYSQESIIYAVRKVNVPEIWITSQDTACWGFDIDSNLAVLLKEINKIDREHWIRVGMGNPNNLIKILDELILQYKSNKVYKFLHIPIQSGNNNVLKHMKRGYTVDDVLYIVNKFKNIFPLLTISTDIICGYPTETKEDFNDTLELIKEIRPSICNISRYWERQGTIAAELNQIPNSERKRRSTKLTKMMKKIQLEDNSQWKGWSGEVLINEVGEKGGYKGRNIYYKPIVINENNIELGTKIKVEIYDFTETYLFGRLI